MRDFAYAVKQIPGLFLYYKGDGSPFGSMTDYGPNAITATMHGFTGNTGQPTCGYLLDQHVPTASMSFQTAHGHVTYSQSNITTAEAALLNNKSWSVAIAGLKPHDMTVARTWFGVGNSDIGLRLIINADGSLRFSGGAGTSATSAAGVIKRFVPHLIVASYDNVAGQVTVYVGDWTGRWITAINAAAIGPVTALVNASPLYCGTAGGAGAGTADGFIDDIAVYAGHAVTSSEAATLLAQAGYTNALSYQPSVGHRNAPLNQAYPASQTLDTNTTAAASAIVTDVARQSGGGGFDYYQFTTAYYIVSKAFRQDSTHWQTITGPTNYGDQSHIMQFEDVPMPYGGSPSLGFQPSGGSDQHLTIYCPETDEIWDMSVMTNSGTDLAPVWSCTYGGKITQASLLWTSFQSSYLGTTATGIPCIMGCPTIAELVAAQSGTALTHGVVYVCYDAAITHVWPAQRHDGSASSAIIEGQLYRLKHDSATDTAISSMAHPTGRAIAKAIQTYGMLIVDKNLYAGLMHTEDQYQFQTVNGYSAYGQDALGNTANGILNGQTFSVNTMSGLPWANLELLSAPVLDPANASQTIRAAPAALSGQRFSDRVTISWPDDPKASYWNVYQNVNSTYSLIGQTFWPTYTAWDPTVTTMAITAVNGGGESVRSADITPVVAPSSLFVAKAWQDSPIATTPISAGALMDLETRLAAYAELTSAAGIGAHTVAATSLTTLTYGTTVTPDLSAGHYNVLSVTDGTAFTLANPLNSPTATQTDQMAVQVTNNAGGAMGTVTFGNAYKFPDAQWANPASGQTAYAIFDWNGANWINVAILPNQTVPVTTQSGTTYTFATSDLGKIVHFTNAGAVTATIPPATFPIGAVLQYRQFGAGVVTVAAGAGVTLHSFGGHVATSGQYATASAHQPSTNTWILSGEIA